MRQAQEMKNFHSRVTERFLLLLALILSIPGFYLILVGPGAHYRLAGSALYGFMALLLAIDLFRAIKKPWRLSLVPWHCRMDGIILLGAAASAWPTAYPWSVLEWVLRLAFCALVFSRLVTLAVAWIAPHRLVQVLIAAVVLWALAGAGFLWLEPNVSNYEDGLWLAFTTGATVGYGDIVPSTPASRIFAVFMVLLGFALLSVVTASIAALFVGEDEKRLERELHADVRSLRKELASLRGELASLRSALTKENPSNGE